MAYTRVMPRSGNGLDGSGSGGDAAGASDGSDGSRTLPLIGWRERVDFLDWQVRGVLAKIDTGACVSALHVVDIEPIDASSVSFRVALDRRLSALSERIVAPICRETSVRSSNGVVQRRFVVAATMSVGDHQSSIEVSLVCRKSMRCRMLLGREALRGDFFVDPEHDYLLTERPKPKRPKRPAGRGKRKARHASDASPSAREQV
jgi:hypothetical protein